MIRWTGPYEGEIDRNGRLKAPVPPERWPYGPPDLHEVCCILRKGGLFCDCKASSCAEENWDWGWRA